MKIILVSATEFEIFPFLKRNKKNSNGNNLTTIRFKKNTVDVLITGVGMTATAFYLGKMLNKKYDLAINAGMAGSFKKNIPLGTVVNVVSDSFADLGAEDGKRFLTLKEMGLQEGKSQKPEIKSVRRPNLILNLPAVKGITVNTVHGNAKSIGRVVKKFNPDVESMEGAAFFFACNLARIPCLQIRGISNYVERRNKKKWEITAAIKNLNTYLEILIVNV